MQRQRGGVELSRPTGLSKKRKPTDRNDLLVSLLGSHVLEVTPQKVITFHLQVP